MKDNKSNTLVIHPKDETTIMLKHVYEGKGFDVIDDPDIPVEELKDAIRSHQRIIFLGHGNQGGMIHPSLISSGRLNPGSRFYVVDDSFASVLKGKDTISMWCFSDSFFRRNHLPGFHTGMIISQRDEAEFFLKECPLSDSELFDSMVHLAKLLGECLDQPPVVMREYILNHYVGNDAITQYNRQHFTILE